MKEQLGYIIVSPTNETPQEVSDEETWSARTRYLNAITFYNTYDEAYRVWEKLEGIRALGRKIRRAEIKLTIWPL